MPANNRKPTLDTSLLYSKLKYKHLLSEQSLSQKHPEDFRFLKEKQLIGPGRIREHAKKLLASGALAGGLLLAAPQIGVFQPHHTDISIVSPQLSIHQTLVVKLSSLLPKNVGPLTEDQEKAISHVLYELFGINAFPQLGSTRLNDVYGFIGAEQHLPRFPGDSVNQHDFCREAGLTPGLGGWGYFAPSRSQLTPELVEKEAYYVAVQTLYLPDWQKRLKFLVDWYKYRKVVVVNPLNGKAVVAVVADAGPAKWTGKQFGGSPEVMASLELNVGKQKGPVILFFVDDPDQKVPLGPVEYNLEGEPVILAKSSQG